MSILDDPTKQQIKQIFNELKNPVILVVFTRDDTIAVPGYECPTCRQNTSLMNEVADLSDSITIDIHDLLKDKEKAADYAVDKVPATIVRGTERHGIRFYGTPSGHEFSALLSAIQIVSTSESGLSRETKDTLHDLSKPIHIQVFITPSCPYCAPAVMLAHRMAFENSLITADMINAQELPTVAQRYNVYAVPKIVINETTQFEGMLDEPSFLQKITTAAAL